MLFTSILYQELDTVPAGTHATQLRDNDLSGVRKGRGLTPYCILAATAPPAEGQAVCAAAHALGYTWENDVHTVTTESVRVKQDVVC